MTKLIWSEVINRYSSNPESFTKNGERFRVSKVGNSIILIDLPSGEQSVSRKNLEKAIALINNGIRLKGPSDYKKKVCDERPSYAWAILRDLGFLEQ